MLVERLHHGCSPLKVVFDGGGERADFNGVGPCTAVLKQAIVRVEQLMGDAEEELSPRATIVNSGYKRDR